MINADYHGMIDYLITSGLKFIARASWQEYHFGYGQFVVDLNLFNTKGVVNVLNTIYTYSLLDSNDRTAAPVVVQINSYFHQIVHTDSRSENSVQTVLPWILQNY